ncbi:PREDICTED: self-incompatibility [Prunus dulcis]|uniref:S-protein homolog n=1 Tax=Prunus dulcis TaxID=3755 RepID=A0A5E4FHU8_PRUDU|nr:S-protein homolog 5-like [Prunus dulcis]VVA26241.1 PREDICTED: self-incompatibility [Prunus dulcis]
MAGGRRSTLVLVAMVVLTLDQTSLQVSAWLGGTVYVRLTNRLEPSNATVTIHCKSGDDDLGDHLVALGETYEFSFKNNIWDSTLFFCNFDWVSGSLGKSVSGTFDIYKARRDQERCLHDCNWLILETGLYSYTLRTKIWENLYSWPQ